MRIQRTAKLGVFVIGFAVGRSGAVDDSGIDRSEVAEVETPLADPAAPPQASRCQSS